MLDLARCYVAGPAHPQLDPVAERHNGVPGVAWLLPVAIARPEPRDLAAHALELAARTGTSTDELACALDYVELAALVFSGRPLQLALVHLGLPSPPAGSPPETGCQSADGLAIGIWALAQGRPLGELLPELAATASPPAVAAAGGLVGLRDGFGPVIAGFDNGPECLALAARLQRLRRPCRRSTVAVGGQCT
jgi:hypothetical protein